MNSCNLCCVLSLDDVRKCACSIRQKNQCNSDTAQATVGCVASGCCGLRVGGKRCC